jgi:tRNA(His) 5'-end guanylyltransferase
MKGQYEVRAQTYLPRRTYTIIRLDGKAFHTFTRGCDKPWDSQLAGAMIDAASATVSEIQGAQFAYVQSDEVSVLLTDFAKTSTDAWFDGNVQKMVSIAASMMTAYFNNSYHYGKTALFDARVFVIPDRTEVENYFIWRQQDCVRNSVAALAQAHFSHNRLHGLSGDEMQELLFQERGINWAQEPEEFKNGTLVHKYFGDNGRSLWASAAAPIFTQFREGLNGLIPTIP